jgi:acetyl-CoA synthetase
MWHCRWWVEWHAQVVGEGRCPIVDTWWQTETGTIAITPLPGAWPTLPGSATLPFFGIRPVILDDKGREQRGACEGILALGQAWPSTIRTVKGDHQRFEETYFSTFPARLAVFDPPSHPAAAARSAAFDLKLLGYMP